MSVESQNKKIVNQGGAATEDLVFGTGASNEELIDTIDSWIRESEPYHNLLLSAQDKAVSYYEGNQTDKNDIPAFSSDTVYNRIFEGTETLVPMVTGTAQEFVAMPGNADERSLMRATKIQSVLDRKWYDMDMQEKLEDVTRDMILKRFGVIEWYWDARIDDVNTRVVDPRLIMIPKLRLHPDRLPYVIRINEWTKDEIKQFFPKFEADKLSVKQKVSTQLSGEIGDVDTTYQVFEVWTDEYVVYKHESEIIDRKPNPYWDFEGEDYVKVNDDKKKKKSKKFFNHLQRPTKPFVFFAPFRTGEAPVARTSIAEIGIPIQDDINTQKRQIVNNLVRMGNGQVRIDKDVMSEEEQEAITNEPGLIIVADGAASRSTVQRDPGLPIPSSHFNNLVDSLQAFDNVFGVHPATRGSATSRTLGGQILNKQQDLSRSDLLTRVLNRGMNDIADGVVQLMKMYYSEQHLIRVVGPDDTVEILHFSRDDIDDGVVIDVKAGQRAPSDPEQMENKAIQLFQIGALAPVDLYKYMQFPNPEKTAERLLLWLQGQLDMETQAHIAEAAAGAMTKAKTEGGAERGTESNTNSLQRTQQAVKGSGPAKLPGKPK